MPHRSRAEFLAAAALFSSAAIPAGASPAPADDVAVVTAPAGRASRQSVDDAWWTGPIVAAGADTLPPGHGYIEPYLLTVTGRDFQTPVSTAFVFYGLAPRLTVGVIPAISYGADAAKKRKLRAADLTLHAHYRLTDSDPSRRRPGLAAAIRLVLPTGRFDRLKTAGSGAGSGAVALQAGIYGQQYFWLPNGRILRARVNITRDFPLSANVQGISVYGTSESYRGKVKPGASTLIDVAGEYSLSKRVVLALDVLWNSAGTTRLRARDGTLEQLGPSRQFSLIPAIEYNFSASRGVIFGTRFAFKGRRNPATITPVIAYSMFL